MTLSERSLLFYYYFNKKNPRIWEVTSRRATSVSFNRVFIKNILEGLLELEFWIFKTNFSRKKQMERH